MADLLCEANQIRKIVIQMLVQAGSGHTAGPLGTADFFTTMYLGKILHYRAKEPEWDGRDRFVLSCGHYVPVLYATLATAGFFPTEELSTLRKMGGRLQGHPEKTVSYLPRPNTKQLPGIENSSGPLGQGASVAVGMAIAGKMDNKKWKVIVLGSDGELQEGQTWEAYMTAVKYRLGNLIFFIDRNDIQISGNVVEVMPVEPLKEKLAAFGMKVFEINGHKPEEIKAVYEKAWMYSDQPKVVIMHTIPGKGVSFMERKYEWHGQTPTREEANMALDELSKLEKPNSIFGIQI